jgi:DNA-directed RNA polymerase beta subunit
MATSNDDSIDDFLLMAIESAYEKEASAQSFKYDDEDQDDEIDGGVDTLLAASEKVLAVNRGLVDPDERDSLRFRKVYGPDKLLKERIDMDADKVMRNTVRRISRTGNLSGINPGHFNSYSEKLITGNPLSLALEEINPMHLTEQSRRVSQMGPGGLPSSTSITEDAQNLHPSEFMFLSAIEGPESERIGVDTRIAWGAKMGSDGNIYQRFRNKRTGKYEWLSAKDLENKIVALPD